MQGDDATSGCNESKPKIKKRKVKKQPTVKCSIVNLNDEAEVGELLENYQKEPSGQPIGRLESSLGDGTETGSESSASAMEGENIALLNANLDPPASQKEPGDSSALDYMRQWTESLDQWTAGQKTVIGQILEQQGRLESMVEELLHKSRCIQPATGYNAEMSSSAGKSKFTVQAEAEKLAEPRKQTFLLEAKVEEAAKPCSKVSLFEEDFQEAERKVGFHRDSQGDMMKHAYSNKWTASVALAAPERPNLPMKTTRESRLANRESLGRLHSVFVQAIWNLRTSELVEEHHHKGRCLHKIEELVENPRFEYFSAGLIFSHSLFIGIYVEYVASVSTDVPTAFKVFNIIFTIGFLFEVLLKALGERVKFMVGHEWAWNVFDCLLLATIAVEIIMSVSLAGKDASEKKKMKTALKLAEMARTMRILRILKVLKFSQTLRLLLTKIFASFRILFWVMLLLVLVMFVVAVCMTQAYNDCLLGEQHKVGFKNLDSNQKEMDHYFGSIPRSAYTLVASICLGLEWDKAFGVLIEASPFYACIFLFFIVLTIFVGMNVLTGVFVDNAMSTNSDMIMDVEEAKRKEHADHLKDMFVSLDRDASDVVSLEEFVRLAHHPVLETYLTAININGDEAETLFHLLDEDGSGFIAIDEFIFGCMHLRGEARSLDMKTLLYENRRLRHKVFKHITATEDMLTEIIARLKPYTAAASRTNLNRKHTGEAAAIMKTVI